MICRHGGQLTHWFTSDRSDWEIRWCERCGALQKFNLFKNKMEWIFPKWIKEQKKGGKERLLLIKKKPSKKRIKKNKK